MRAVSSASHDQHTALAHADRVRSWLKALVVVAVTLPIAAYVVATLGASPAQPTPHDPVILREPAPSSSPSSSPSGSPSGVPDEREQGDDVRVVKPSPKRVGDDDGPSDDRPDDRPDDDGPDETDDDTTDDRTDDGSDDDTDHDTDHSTDHGGD
jgi:hypothetical protein